MHRAVCCRRARMQQVNEHSANEKVSFRRNLFGIAVSDEEEQTWTSSKF